MAIANSWKRMTAFLSETKSEVKKVTFPSRPEVMTTTIVVIVASFLFAFFLWVADMLILRGYRFIMGFFGQ